ncbi:MAG TPA: DUF998 domain-containing protein [Candidatus Limnocylindria bacterium]|nr:DUF998 domain-containing protein [Candidatus Limnocylindria bacterium]
MVAQSPSAPGVARQRAAPDGQADAALIIPGAMLFLVGVAFLTVSMLAASIAPGYDFHAAAISDLGVIDETAAIFNGLLIVVGALNSGAGLLLYRAHRRARVLGLYLLAGAGAIGAGLVPLDVGGPHAMFALVGFVFFNLEALATAPLVRGPMRLVSVAAGVVGTVYVAIMVLGDAGNAAIFGSIGHGGAERMIVFPAMLWTVAFGGYLMAGGVARAHGSERP